MSAREQKASSPDPDAEEPRGMELRQLVRTDSVLCNVEARSKKHALEILSELLSHGAEELRQQEIFAALAERERLGCTALGHAVAAPHARIEGAPYPVGALLKLSTPVDFDTADGGPVDLIFGLIVPEDVGEDQIAGFRRLTEILSRSETQDQLRAARSSRELYEALMRQQAPADTAAEDQGESSAKVRGHGHGA